MVKARAVFKPTVSALFSRPFSFPVSRSINHPPIADRLVTCRQLDQQPHLSSIYRTSKYWIYNLIYATDRAQGRVAHPEESCKLRAHGERRRVR